mgnify:FL=1
MTQNKKYLLRKIGKRVCHVAMTISSVAVIASTTVSANEVVTSNDANVTLTTEAKDDSNAKLLETIKKAKENHVIVELTKDVNYKNASEANADIDGQIKTINGLVELVSNANERLSKVVDEATKAGVKLDKEIKLTLTPGKEDDFKKAVEEAEKKLKDSITKQTEISKSLTDAIAKAEQAGVKVTVKGEKIVTAEDANEAIKQELDKIDQAIRQQSESVSVESKTLQAKLSSDSTATNNNGVYHQILKGKSLLDEASSETVQRKPMDLIAIVDFSSSLQVKRTEALTQLKTLIEKNLTDDDKIMLQGYIYNKEASYAAHGAQLDYSKLKEADWGVGFSTKLITKAEALSIVDKWLGIIPPNTPNGVATYSDYFNAATKAMGDLGFKTDDADGATPVKTVPFEEIYTSQPNRHQTVSVIQFTDGWMDTEKMDPTFADWAKQNAKTFMSVVNRNQVSEYDNNGEFSINSMRALGHPNIYESTGKDKEVVMKEILEQFENTAVEKFTSKKKITSKGVVSIKADENVTLVSANLVSPSGNKQELKIENNAVSAEVDLTEKGDYTVEYEFSAKNNEAGNVTGSFVVNSKEELSGDKVDAASKDLESTKDEKTDKLVPTAEIGVDVEKIVISTDKPVVEDVKTTAHKTKTEKQLPKTGTDASTITIALGTVFAALGGLVVRKKKN